MRVPFRDNDPEPIDGLYHQRMREGNPYEWDLPSTLTQTYIVWRVNGTVLARVRPHGTERELRPRMDLVGRPGDFNDPQQLAAAMLADWFGDECARERYAEFATEIICRERRDRWQITSDEINTWLELGPLTVCVDCGAARRIGEVMASRRRPLVNLCRPCWLAEIRSPVQGVRQ